MNKLYLMKNPHLFQGEKYLNKNTNYFEGWYFKNTNQQYGVSFIPGISIDNENKEAFIQVITKNNSYYVKYNIEDFCFSNSPFYIKIGNSTFSKEGLLIDIKDEKQDLNIKGRIKYLNSKNINTNILNPNIMGPFSYIPFMECNHAILSMKNEINGSIEINSSKMNFDNGIGYIEKDWGCSFPKYYIWCQANNFKNKDASFMLSVADIPFGLFNFRGMICVFRIKEKEYKFATYNNAKIIKYEAENGVLDIILKNGSYLLEITSNYEEGNKLTAPVKGKMKKDILENISSFINVTLKKEDNIIFSDTSSNCGLEIVKDNSNYK